MKKKRKKNPNMARYGPQNGRWKGGKSKTYYRRVARCKRGDKKIVHHLDKGKKPPYKKKVIKVPHTKDVVIVLDNRGNSSRSKHNRVHPEKGGRKR